MTYALLAETKSLVNFSKNPKAGTVCNYDAASFQAKMLPQQQSSPLGTIGHVIKLAYKDKIND